MPAPPPGVEPPPLWGLEAHIDDVFRAAGTVPSLVRESVEFEFPSVADAVRAYADDFGPFVIARRLLEPQGRWDEFLDAFEALVRRFNTAPDGAVRIRSGYFVISIDR
jgi:hypothetical protein